MTSQIERKHISSILFATAAEARRLTKIAEDLDESVTCLVGKSCDTDLNIKDFQKLDYLRQSMSVVASVVADLGRELQDRVDIEFDVSELSRDVKPHDMRDCCLGISQSSGQDADGSSGDLELL